MPLMTTPMYVTFHFHAIWPLLFKYNPVQFANDDTICYS